jgi:hypothetical protein
VVLWTGVFWRDEKWCYGLECSGEMRSGAMDWSVLDQDRDSW